MRTAVRLVVPGMLVVTVTACQTGSSPSSATSAQYSTHEGIIKEAIQSIRTVTQYIDSARDPKSTMTAENAVRGQTKYLEWLKETMVSLGSASDAERQRVNRHSHEVVQATQELHQSYAHMIYRIYKTKDLGGTGRSLGGAASDYGYQLDQFGEQSWRLCALQVPRFVRPPKP